MNLGVVEVAPFLAVADVTIEIVADDLDFGGFAIEIESQAPGAARGVSVEGEYWLSRQHTLEEREIPFNALRSRCASCSIFLVQAVQIAHPPQKVTGRIEFDACKWPRRRLFGH